MRRRKIQWKQSMRAAYSDCQLKSPQAVLMRLAFDLYAHGCRHQFLVTDNHLQDAVFGLEFRLFGQGGFAA